ncbi:hypothetical protein GCM10009558_028760 [Virgisporangium aurantiacum]
MSGADEELSGRRTGAPGDTPLTGFTIAVTAERRRDEQSVLLERRGARVVSVPVITHVPLLDDEALHEATRECIDNAPDLVVVNTGIGFRGWLEAAEGWGLGDELRAGLARAALIARGAKPCGAIRAAGLSEVWSAPSESCEEIQERLLAEGVAGRRIAVQLHGGVQMDFVNALRSAGTEVGAELARLLVERCAATVVGPDEPADDLVLLDALGDTMGETAEDPTGEPALLPEWFPALRQAALTGAGLFVVVNDRDPRADGLAGFFRSLRRERPEAIARLVAVEAGRSAATTAGAVLAELAVRDSEPVARLGSERLICVTTPEPLPEGTDAAAAIGLTPQSVLLVVGGARGITSVVARQFAAASGCRVAIAGRTVPAPEPEDPELAAAADLTALRAVLAGRDPSDVDARARAVLARREVARTLDELHRCTRDAWYTPVDVTDAEAVHSLVKHVYARHGRLDGVVFAAGVIEDRLLADKSAESFRRVFATKVDGARNLLGALRDLREGPRFVTLFGSIASVRGSRGQCDYAAANDAMAELGRRWARDTGRRCLTVHWGPWAPSGGGMVTPELAARYARHGVRLIDPVRGATGLLDELAWGDPSLTSVVHTAPGW